MKNRNTRRYAVKTGDSKHSRIVSSHCTLRGAYKSFVRFHKSRFSHLKFPMARDPRSIISSEESSEEILADIHSWATYHGLGPPSKLRLPLPIVVHQWNPGLGIYQIFGYEKTSK